MERCIYYNERMADTDDAQMQVWNEMYHMQVRSIETTLKQAPTEANGFMAVCETTIKTPKQIITAIGYATPDVYKTESPGVLLEFANLESQRAAAFSLEVQQQNDEANETTSDQEETVQQIDEQVKPTPRHASHDNTPVSDEQLAHLDALEENSELSATSICISRYKKFPEELLAREAADIIEDLK